MAASEGSVCWICLECGPDDGDKPLVRNCSCRGDDAGFAHVSCLAGYARSRNADHTRKSKGVIDVNEITRPWRTCPNCLQLYGGSVCTELAQMFWDDAKDLGEDHPNYLSGLLALADAFTGTGQYEKAHKNFKRLASLLAVHADSVGARTVNDPLALRVSVLDRLSGASIGIDDLVQALFYAKESLNVAEELYGEGSSATEEQRGNVSMLEGLIGVHHGEGSMTEFKVRQFTENYERHRRRNGEEYHETLFTKALLGQAHCESGNKIEGMKMIEEAFSLSNRVYGPEHDRSLAIGKIKAETEAKLIGLEKLKPEINGKDAEARTDEEADAAAAALLAELDLEEEMAAKKKTKTRTGKKKKKGKKKK